MISKATKKKKRQTKASTLPPLSKQQRHFKEVLQKLSGKSGKMPSLDELAAEMGRARSTTCELKTALIEKGHITVQEVLEIRAS